MQEILKIYSKYLTKNGSIAKENSSLYNYIIAPFSAGLAGFATFLFLLILMDFIAYLFGITQTMNVGINEVLIASLGFLLQFAYQLVRSIQQI